MAQQTAVEWLQERYNQGNDYERHLTEREFKQAKQMEKEQIINAMLEEHMFDDSEYANRRYKYWQEVKQQLNGSNNQI